MDSEVARSAWFYDLVAWLQLNRKRVLIGAVVALVVAVAASAMIYTQNQKEVNASEALSEIRAPMNPATPPPPGLVDAYLKIARDYAGTKAAARALLVAGGALYVEGDEAKLGLGRLYEVQNKPAQALKLYEELLRANPYGGIAQEAGIRHAEIIEKHPELAMTNALALAPSPLPTPSNPPVKASTNKSAIVITNLLKTPAANTPRAPATNAPLLIKPDAAATKP